MKRQRLKITRREFLIGMTAAGTGFSLGMSLPMAVAKTAASGSADASSTPEINAWVVIEPDDTVIIRIARSEMGQGTLTGLAQL
ncbi:MAG: molybdopterin-dependent oxidoreductase, partial [Chromatiales bacterium]